MFVDVFPFSMFPYCSYIQRGKNNPLPVIYCFSLGCKGLPQKISQGGMGAGWDKLALAPSFSPLFFPEGLEVPGLQGCTLHHLDAVILLGLLMQELTCLLVLIHITISSTGPDLH